MTLFEAIVMKALMFFVLSAVHQTNSGGGLNLSFLLSVFLLLLLHHLDIVKKNHDFFFLVKDR